MKNMKNKQKKDVLVTLLLTESTSSLLNLEIPYMENTLSKNSKICIITEKEFRSLMCELPKDQEEPIASTSVGVGDNCLKLNSEVALFSVSSCSSKSESYQLSHGSEISISSSSNSTELFKKTNVVLHPLVAVKSMAHANKLHVDQNNVYVTLLDTDSVFSSELMCRICHGGESIGDLLTPCRCKGSIALVHLKCLERWLKESNHSSCELCQHRFKIIREPRYSILWSVLVFLRHPGIHLKEIILDLIAFTIYTPTAVASTYMLMLICEALVKNSLVTTGSLSSHIIAFTAVFGMAIIDFTYSSWLIMTLQKHIDAWRDWYNANSRIKIVLPNVKMRPLKKKKRE